jgi:hypothetical protein
VKFGFINLVITKHKGMQNLRCIIFSADKLISFASRKVESLQNARTGMEWKTEGIVVF